MGKRQRFHRRRRASVQLTMDNFQIDEILSTFKIIADRREQDTPKARERYKAFGVPVIRATLDYGDYAAQITLPSGDLLDISNRCRPQCVVERKMSLDELAGCLTRGRDRFEMEFERATSNNARVFLLVENASWEALLNHRYRSRFHPNAFKASLSAWLIRYNLYPIFCKSGTSAELIREVLYRDIKERLVRGEYG